MSPVEDQTGDRAAVAEELLPELRGGDGSGGRSGEEPLEGEHEKEAAVASAEKGFFGGSPRTGEDDGFRPPFGVRLEIGGRGFVVDAEPVQVDGVAHERKYLFRREHVFQVPNDAIAVIRTRQEELVVAAPARGELDIVDNLLVLRQQADLLAPREAFEPPQADGAVRTRRGAELVVRTDGQVGDLPVVPLKSADERPVPGAPHLDETVFRAGEEKGAGGVDDGAVDGDQVAVDRF